jgi:DNA-directed RNA polymerase specialized sigma24 family protein
MPDEAGRDAARRAVREAQASFEKEAEAVRGARRKAFADAQNAGLSLREIAEETGLHHSTVAEIARGG